MDANAHHFNLVHEKLRNHGKSLANHQFPYSFHIVSMNFHQFIASKIANLISPRPRVVVVRALRGQRALDRRPRGGSTPATRHRGHGGGGEGQRSERIWG